MTKPRDWTPELERELIEESDRVFALEAASEEATRLPEGAVISRPNRSRSVVYSVRLTREQVAAIETVATRMQAPASALVRGWVLAGLAADTDSVSATIDRLEAELRQLRRLVSR